MNFAPKFCRALIRYCFIVVYPYFFPSLLCTFELCARKNVAVPVIVNRDSWDTEIEISTSCVQDTLRIVVTVVCRFDTDLYLKTRKAQLVQVSLDKVEFMVRTNGAYRRQVYQGREECKDDDGSRCIWDLCTEKVLTWMWAQSYAYLDGDVFDESGVYFHALDRRYRFPLYLIPES